MTQLTLIFLQNLIESFALLLEEIITTLLFICISSIKLITKDRCSAAPQQRVVCLWVNQSKTKTPPIKKCLANLYVLFNPEYLVASCGTSAIEMNFNLILTTLTFRILSSSCDLNQINVIFIKEKKKLIPMFLPVICYPFVVDVI